MQLDADTLKGNYLGRMALVLVLVALLVLFVAPCLAVDFNGVARFQGVDFASLLPAFVCRVVLWRLLIVLP
eukprot:46882-Pleurochrysis_carterae.AAC.1